MTEVDALKDACAVLLAEVRFYWSNPAIRAGLRGKRPISHLNLFSEQRARDMASVIIRLDKPEFKTGEVIDHLLIELCGQDTKPLQPVEKQP